jgi:hypothetical protein
METTNALDVQRLLDAKTLRSLVEREQSEDAEGVDLLLLILLDNFIRDEDYRLGSTPNPYCDDTQRLTFLKQVLRTVDKVYDKLAQGMVGQLSIPAVDGLCRLLFDISLSTFHVVRAIEANYPEQAAFFAADRTAYAAMREGVTL